MCTYLDQVGSIYYFRRAVPGELRSVILTSSGAPRTEWKLSLRTKDRETAKRLIPRYTVDTQREIDAAVHKLIGRIDQSPQESPAEPAERYSARAAAMEAALIEASLEAAEKGERELSEKEARYEAREAERAYYRRRITLTTRQLTPAEAAVKDLLAEESFSAEIAQAQIAYLRLELKAAKAARNPDLLAHELPPELVTQFEPTAADDSGAQLDGEIVDRWAAERLVSPKGVDTHRAVARWFYERVGRKPVGSITRRDVLAFKDKLVAEGQTPANIVMKLSRLRTLLQWAADNDHASENVAAGVRVIDTAQAKNKRVEFDLASLNAIFSSPVYASGDRPAGGKGDAAYWLPLLALFTGARLEELGQLRPSDVQELSYPTLDGTINRWWFVRIREDDADDMSLKNANSERDVPVHPELSRLGFLAYVDAMSVAGEVRLFPRLRANVYGRLTAKWGEWFSPYLRQVCGVTDKRMVFHSFRHTFKHYARHVGMIEGIQRQIMGHSSGDVADQYGSGYPLHQVVEGLASYRVPGLVLDFANVA